MHSRNPLAGGRWTFAFLVAAVLALAASVRARTSPRGQRLRPRRGAAEAPSGGALLMDRLGRRTVLWLCLLIGSVACWPLKSPPASGTALSGGVATVPNL